MARALGRLCVACQQRPRSSPHFNCKYCAACRAVRLRQPPSAVTPAQRAAIVRLAGTMTRREIAVQVGIALPAVSRCLREEGLRSNVRGYPQEVIEAVSRVYAAAPKGQGKAAVREAFPDVVVRSIVERLAHHRGASVRRQVRWTGEQLIDAARMAGLVSVTAQARYFGRPNALGGSIKALWSKHFQCASRDINGLDASRAYQIARPGVPAVVTAPDNMGPNPKVKVLWLDLIHYLRPDVEPAVRQCIEALALFQTWLHGTDLAADIPTMIQELEAHYGNTHSPSDEQRLPPGDPPRGPGSPTRDGHRADPEYARGRADAASPHAGGHQGRGHAGQCLSGV